MIDPAGPGAGASGGVVGALAPHVPENWNVKKAFQFEALTMAGAFWREVDRISGLSSGFGRTGRLQPLADARAVELARARASSADRLWQGRAVWEIIAAPGGWAPPSPTGLVIRDTLSARLHPARAVASLAGAVTCLGGEIARAGPDRGAVVHATGTTGLADLSDAFARPLGTGVKGQAATLGFDAGPDAPQLFIHGLHLVPQDDATVGIGSTSERDHDHPATTDARLDALIERVRELCPVLRDAPVRARWAGLRPRARTRAPLIGPWPGRPGHFVANGGFKIGFGIAPAVADAMAALVLEGQDRIPADFRVERALT